MSTENNKITDDEEKDVDKVDDDQRGTLTNQETSNNFITAEEKDDGLNNICNLIETSCHNHQPEPFMQDYFY